MRPGSADHEPAARRGEASDSVGPSDPVVAAGPKFHTVGRAHPPLISALPRKTGQPPEKNAHGVDGMTLEEPLVGPENRSGRSSGPQAWQSGLIWRPNPDRFRVLPPAVPRPAGGRSSVADVARRSGSRGPSPGRSRIRPDPDRADSHAKHRGTPRPRHLGSSRTAGPGRPHRASSSRHRPDRRIDRSAPACRFRELIELSALIPRRLDDRPRAIAP